MNVNKETSEKYLNIILNDIEDVTFFAINNVLIDNHHFDPQTDEERNNFFEIVKAVTELGKTYGYFEKLGSGNWYKLTEKGIEAKENGGHIKYKKDNKKSSLTLFEKISIFFLVLSFSYNFYQDTQKDNLKNDNQILINKIDSLQTQNKVLRDSIISIKDKKENRTSHNNGLAQ